MNNKILIPIVGIVAFIVGGGIGFGFGNTQGGDREYQRGYQTAEADLKKVQEEAANKAISEASKAANPFQAVNPLEGVETNPFEKTKQILNPFE